MSRQTPKNYKQGALGIATAADLAVNSSCALAAIVTKTGERFRVHLIGGKLASLAGSEDKTIQMESNRRLPNHSIDKIGELQ